MARGVRFAPSPTGRFHVGNLRTAWISHHLSRRLQLPWVVRFEDIDRPRVVQNAIELQTRDLWSLELRPDQVFVQSQNRERHWKIFLKAVSEGQVYPCFCSRKDVREAIQESASARHGIEPVYSGACRKLLNVSHSVSGSAAVGWRFKMENESGALDPVIARTSGLKLLADADSCGFVPAYHWACAIDDLDGECMVLVRAWDLEHAVVFQRAVQEWLVKLERRVAGLPAVFHCAVVTGALGERLEKRTKGVTLPELIAHGISAEALKKKFEASFTDVLGNIEPGRVYGELKKFITLEELGISL
ncbi:MAG TPA: glutamate--tRNA ligase family protein [Bdellovibrionota bacterium]|nr:glutamate--tRNA ligase family protein [Bdellovibrionota bacterium]